MFRRPSATDHYDWTLGCAPLPGKWEKIHKVAKRSYCADFSERWCDCWQAGCKGELHFASFLVLCTDQNTLKADSTKVSVSGLVPETAAHQDQHNEKKIKELRAIAYQALEEQWKCDIHSTSMRPAFYWPNPVNPGHCRPLTKSNLGYWAMLHVSKLRVQLLVLLTDSFRYQIHHATP